MLSRLLRTYLAPYRRPITGLLILSLAGTMAALLLPSLNAAIIDEGVARGDIAYIWRTGRLMLAVSLVQVACSIWATYLGAKTAMSSAVTYATRSSSEYFRFLPGRSTTSGRRR